MSFVQCVIPLLPLDRLVLDRVESILHSFDILKIFPTSADQCEVFQHWEWTTHITKYLHQELEGESVEADHDDDRNIAYIDLFRVNALEKANPSFLVELSNRRAQDVKCVPASQDAHYWGLLQAIYSHGKLKLRKDSVFQPTKAFGIWEAVQTLLIQSTLIENASESYINVLSHPGFKSLYEFRPNSDSQEENPATHAADNPEAHRERFHEEMTTDAWKTEQGWQIFHRLNHGHMERVSCPCPFRAKGFTVRLQWPNDKAQYDANETITYDYLVCTYCTFIFVYAE
jgi:hypothetical protein